MKKSNIFSDKNRMNLIILALCVFFNAVAILLSQNEIYQDDWYIQASVDGLFGNDNRSLLVLCTNFFFSFILYLLSLTGLRLFWLHILLVVMNFVSSYLVCIVIANNFKGKIKYYICSIFLIAIAPLVSFEMQFTTTAAYVIAAGCLWLFEAMEKRKKKGAYIFGIAWICLGSSIRFDCIYYSLIFMGLVWIFKMGIRIYADYKQKKLINIKEKLFRNLLPFLVALILVFSMEFAQRLAMNYVNPGFSEWNTVRSSIDDYNIPDYYSNIDQYKALGLSYNDYQLLKSWNNLDPDFFTEDLYKQIKEIKDTNEPIVQTEESFFAFIVYLWSNVSDHIAFWLVLVCILLIGIFCDYKKFLMSCGLGLSALILTAYFLIKGRLIWRTEWPIWITICIAFIALLISAQGVCIKKINISKYKTVLLLGAVALAILVIAPQKNVSSVLQLYIARYENENNFGRYLKNKLFKEETIQYVTHDSYITSSLFQNKDLFYFPLWTNNWLQQYPVTDKDIFRTAPIGTAENWGTLGQYMIRLKPIQNNFTNYGITNPFKDLVKDFVRVVVRSDEAYARTRELYQYLKEHYYPNVNFSVVEIVDNAIVGRYLNNFEVSQIDDMISVDGNFDITYSKSADYNGFSIINIDNVNIENFDSDIDEAYLRLTNQSGEEYTFSLMQNTASPQAMIYDNILLEGETYEVNLIFLYEDEWYCTENSEILTTDNLLSENSMQNLNIIDGQRNDLALQGYDIYETDHVWTTKYSSIKLLNEQISNTGLRMKFVIPDYPIKGTEKIKIYVNGERVYTLDPEYGEYDIVIPAEEIRNETGKYIVEIVSPYTVNPAKDWGTEDNRDLSVLVYYIGQA